MTLSFLKTRLFLYSFQLVLIGMLSFTTSCNDDSGRLEGGVLPENEELKGLNYDGHKLVSENTKQDRVKTNDATKGILGEYNDPILGTSKAEFLCDFSTNWKVEYKNLSVYNESENKFETKTYSRFANGTEWQVDSAVLELQYTYNNWYGDMESTHEVSVYELGTSLGNNNTIYYSDQDVNAFSPSTTPVAKKIVSINDDILTDYRSVYTGTKLWESPYLLRTSPSYLWDITKVSADISSGKLASSFVGHTTTLKYWHFKLSDALRDKLFNLSETDLQNSDAFKKVFKGLYITSKKKGGDGSLVSINLLSQTKVTSSIKLYYKRTYLAKEGKKTDGISDSIVTKVDYEDEPYIFPINRENVRFNKYTHTVNSNLIINDPSTPMLYIQGMAGTNTKFKLPTDIFTWADSLRQDDRSTSYLIGISNIEFYLQLDSTTYNSTDAFYRYPIPATLELKWIKDGITQVPALNETNYNNTVFGVALDKLGTKGIGERADRINEKGEVEYRYRYIMRPEYFTYVMRKVQQKIDDDGALSEQDKKDLIEQYFTFYVGPENTTSSFNRVILYGANHGTMPFKMNIKYYQYNPR